MSKTIIARARFVPTSPRKLRLVADAVRNLSLQLALDQLKMLPKAAAKPILLVLQQAVGNAKTGGVSPEGLTISSLQIEEGPRFKRRDVHAHSARFDSGMRRRRTAHVVIHLATKN